MNILFKKMCIEDFGNDLTFGDFLEVAQVLDLPFFVVSIVNNPFSEPHSEKGFYTYRCAKDFRRSMPNWSVRHYDYENDRALGFRRNVAICTCEFTFSDSNNYASYTWSFNVLECCVVVHETMTYLD